MSRYCILCGSELILGGNDMLSDFNDEIIDDKDDGMVTNATCPKCHAEYIMVDATENEKEENKSFIGRIEIFK